MPKIKEKRVIKTKEELLKELEGNVKFQEKMKFTKEKFYPALVAASRNVEDAQQFLSSINTLLMQDWIGRMKDIKTSEMKLIDKLDSKDEKFEEYATLLNLFNDFTVFDFKDCVEGMRSELGLFVSEEMQNRPLETLKTKWLDEK